MGEVVEHPGERRPFSPFGEVQRPNWTRFLYVGIREGWASRESDFIEHHYRANWVDGIDLITLEGQMGYGRLGNPETGEPHSRNPDPDKDNPVQRYGIAVIKGKDEPPSGYNVDFKKVSYPSGYQHTIELPHRLAQLIYAFDQKAGAAFIGDIKRTMQPTPPSSSPVLR